VKATMLRSCIRQRVSDSEQSSTRARRRRDGWRQRQRSGARGIGRPEICLPDDEGHVVSTAFALRLVCRVPASHPPRRAQHPTREKPRGFRANVPTPHATPRRERDVCVSHHADGQPMAWPAAFPDGRLFIRLAAESSATSHGQTKRGSLAASSSSVQPPVQDPGGRTPCYRKIMSCTDYRNQLEAQDVISAS
jgi:hypothetical protein